MNCPLSVRTSFPTTCEYPHALHRSTAPSSAPKSRSTASTTPTTRDPPFRRTRSPHVQRHDFPLVVSSSVATPNRDPLAASTTSLFESIPWVKSLRLAAPRRRLDLARASATSTRTSRSPSSSSRRARPASSSVVVAPAGTTVRPPSTSSLVRRPSRARVRARRRPRARSRRARARRSTLSRRLPSPSPRVLARAPRAAARGPRPSLSRDASHVRRSTRRERAKNSSPSFAASPPRGRSRAATCEVASARARFRHWARVYHHWISISNRLEYCIVRVVGRVKNNLMSVRAFSRGDDPHTASVDRRRASEARADRGRAMSEGISRRFSASPGRDTPSTRKGRLSIINWRVLRQSQCARRGRRVERHLRSKNPCVVYDLPRRRRNAADVVAACERR